MVPKQDVYSYLDEIQPPSYTDLGQAPKSYEDPSIFKISDGKGSDSTLKMVSINSSASDLNRSFDVEKPDRQSDEKIDKNAEKLPLHGRKEEKWWNTLFQVAIPFFIAGGGTIAAGLVLGIVQNWEVFLNVSAIFVLVPSLSGLKGNLDMCLASRLSTQANLGNMNSMKEVISMVVGNISLVQVQAIVAATVVSIFAMTVNAVTDRSFSINNALLLSSSAIFTATTTCFVLDFVMVLVICSAQHFKMNPDNVATPLAASIGDVVSNTVLAFTAQYMYDTMKVSLWQPLVLLAIYFSMLPLWIFVVARNKYTRPVLMTGWTPVISALFISGLGGMVLDQAVDRFHGFVVFQPIVNGIGGNLVSVQSSRISTHLHQTAMPGVLPENTRLMEWPWKALLFGSAGAKIARMLIILAVLGQIVFMIVADYVFMGYVSVQLPFGFAYVFCATTQVIVLLYCAHVLVHLMWKKKKDPDNAAIPYLTALGDLLGSVFLGLAFLILHSAGQEYGAVAAEAVVAAP